MRAFNMIMAAGVVLTGVGAGVQAPVAAQGVVVAVGAPSGPGWNRWHDRRRVYARGWGGPVYYRERGPHYGWYRWNNNYYQNCSWRGRRQREWHCW